MTDLSYPSGRRTLIAYAIALLAGLGSLGQYPLYAEEGEADKKDEISLVIDYGDGVQKHVALPWKEKMTVHDALMAGSEHPRGIKVKSRGQGETLFVTAIDDCENEGSGRNWTYRVNGKSATKSSGIAEIASGDVVLWKFASSR